MIDIVEAVASFTRVRTFGWLHPAAKVRANRVRALLGEKGRLSAAEEQTSRFQKQPANVRAEHHAPETDSYGLTRGSGKGAYAPVD